MTVHNEIFDDDGIKEFLSGELNRFSSPIHLRIQDEKIKNLNSFMIAEEFQRRGHFVVWEKKSNIEVIGFQPKLTFSFSHLKGFSRLAIRLLRDKGVFKKALKKAGISVAPDIALSVDEKERGRRFIAESEVACVIKPACGHKGKGVTVGVNTEAQFDYAWALAIENNRNNSNILIEKQFTGGVEARFLVVGGKCVSACRRIPPIVVGDGESTVEELIKEKNKEKRKSPGLVIRQIKLDAHRTELIKAQGYALDDVPKLGSYLLIDYKAGASTGADTLEISDLVHPRYREIAEKVSRVAKDIPVLGVDIISRNFSEAPTRNSYVVLEANVAPGLSGHCYPSYGEKKDIITPIVDYALSLAKPVAATRAPACSMAEKQLVEEASTSFAEKHQELLKSGTDRGAESISSVLDPAGLTTLATRIYEHNRLGESLVFFERSPSMVKPLTVTFCGDTSLGYYYLEKSKRKYAEAYERLQKDPMSFFDGVKPVLEGSDEVIVNLETVLSHEPGAPIEGKEYPGCDDPDVTIKVLKALGVTAVTLANNHSMDFGPDKMLAMIEKLESHGIAVIGAGRNLEEARKPYRIQVQTRDGVKNIYILNGMRSTRRYAGYGFFAKQDTPGIASTNLKGMSLEIRKIKDEDPSSTVIVCPHWQGIDYQDTSEKHQEWCRSIIDAGADHVIAHGSHKADNIEAYGGGTIFYSIGNFIFNSPGRYLSKGAKPYSLIPRLTFDDLQGGEKGKFSVSRIITDNKATNFRVSVAEDGMSGQSVAVEEYEAIADEVTEEGSGMDFSLREKNTYEAKRPFSTSPLLAQELGRLGFSTRKRGGILEASLKGRVCTFMETETSFTSLVAYRILKDKERARDFLEGAGIQVAKGAAFTLDEKDLAREFVKDLGRVVVKPVDGNKGKGVSVNIGLEEFEEAWGSAAQYTKKKIIVEGYFSNGKEARYLVVDGKCVAVSMRIPPQVKGDGKKTIAELIELENAARKKNPNLMRRLLKIDGSRLTGLRQRSYDLSSVLKPEEVVIIDTKANLSTGANSVDITDNVHPSMKRVAERVALSIPGLDVVGIDILASNHEQEAQVGNYIIVEANTRPGIGGHHYPTYGEPRNVARFIAESVARKFGGATR
ncbi:CapA family protein [Halomonas heilongjiangensis]|nr:CapA family protein [Halomonas heilongjiangensis]